MAADTAAGVGGIGGGNVDWGTPLESLSRAREHTSRTSRHSCSQDRQLKGVPYIVRVSVSRTLVEGGLSAGHCAGSGRCFG